jgi:hypothetical protein
MPKLSSIQFGNVNYPLCKVGGLFHTIFLTFQLCSMHGFYFGINFEHA